jgi:pimeloyl-ACP methyl ester carboxylesterase
MASPAESTRARQAAAPAAEPARALRDVTVRGVRVRAELIGSADLPPLFLLHDVLTSRLEWRDIDDELARRFHVIAPDLPGFGESEKPSPARFSYGVEAFAESVADLFAAFGAGRTAVVGHGLGGAIAITLAASFPELVSRLVLIDPLCYPFPLGLRARALLAPVLGSIAFKQLYGRAAFRARFRESVFGPGAAVPEERVDQHYDLFNTPESRESAHAVLRATLDTRPVVARLSRVTAPSLVVWGRDDRIFPAALAPRLAREIRGARLALLDTGHSPHEERAEELLAVLVPFLEGKRG